MQKESAERTRVAPSRESVQQNTSHFSPNINQKHARKAS
jgi:hypothetical protein